MDAASAGKVAAWAGVILAVVPQLATYFTDTRLEVAARSATLFAMAPEVDVSAQAEAWSQAANRVFEATMETAVTPP